MKVGGLVYETVTRLGELILLSLVFMLACLPVFTVGPALSAAFAVINKFVREEGVAPVRDFFRFFRRDFRVSFAGGIVLVLAYGLLAYNWVLLLPLSGTAADAWRIGIALATLLVTAISLWFFTLTSQFENSVKTHLYNAVMMTVQSPRALVAATFWAVPLALAFFVPRVWLGLLFGYLCFGVGLTFYLQALLLARPLNKLRPVPEPEEESELAGEASEEVEGTGVRPWELGNRMKKESDE